MEVNCLCLGKLSTALLSSALSFNLYFQKQDVLLIKDVLVPKDIELPPNLPLAGPFCINYLNF